jgi:putative autoinducer-2 (AI-2) aldolase
LPVKEGKEDPMDWGMQNRLSRIIRPEDGRAIMLAVDHGYFLGPLSKLEEPRATITPLLPYTDSLMLTRGVLRNCVNPGVDTAIVLRVSGGQSIVGPALSDETITTSIEDVLRLNATAVAHSIYVGTQHEHQTLAALADLVNEGQEVGVPVLAVTAVGKELEKRDARYLSLCCRIAAEFGVQVVKTYYCEDFEKVTGSCPVPIVIAGGPKLETELDALRMVHDALAQGAVGVDMGRNIWQSEHPVPMIRSVRAIVHEGKGPEEAHDLYQSLKG